MKERIIILCGLLIAFIVVNLGVRFVLHKEPLSTAGEPLKTQQAERKKILRKAKEDLRSFDYRKREAAAGIIKDLEGKELVEDILEQAFEEDVEWLLRRLVVMIGEWGDETMIPRLIKLKHTDNLRRGSVDEEIDEAINMIKGRAEHK